MFYFEARVIENVTRRFGYIEKVILLSNIWKNTVYNLIYEPFVFLHLPLTSTSRH